MSARLETGRLLGGRYRLDALLARGGMAEVWAAKDQTLTRTVAVKVLHPHLADDDSFRRRFRAEAVAAARLVHPNIVAIYDTCDDDGTDAIVMELVHGRTLRDYLDERGRLEPDEVVHLGAEVSAGLACAHRQGVIHRDVKPANIMLSDDGRVLVTDFGIAKVLDSADVTQTSDLLGTVKYLAPEQLEGHPVDGRTDVYALGAVLYECLCGRAPFERESPSATALARLTYSPEPASHRAQGVSPALDTVLARALARVPADRYTSALDLRTALLAAPTNHLASDATIVVPLQDAVTAGPEDHQSGSSTTIATRLPDTHPARRARRSPTGIIAAALVTAALVVIALLIATTRLGHDLLKGSTDTPSTTTAPAATVPITAARSFDPEGTGTPGENEAAVANVIDGQTATVWNSETYSTRTFGNLKRGVGLIVTVPPGTRLRQLRINSPVQDWAVEVYVANSVAPSLEGWGPVRATAAGIDGGTQLDLSRAEGSQVLVWFTDLGAGPTYRMVVSDLALEG